MRGHHVRRKIRCPLSVEWHPTQRAHAIHRVACQSKALYPLSPYSTQHMTLTVGDRHNKRIIYDWPSARTNNVHVRIAVTRKIRMKLPYLSAITASRRRWIKLTPQWGGGRFVDDSQWQQLSAERHNTLSHIAHMITALCKKKKDSQDEIACEWQTL